MSLTFVTGNQHFGHSDIIRRCGRPFADADEMDEELIRRWRKAVSPADTVYVLGDFAHNCLLDYAQSILDRLYGRKILVAGEHDRKIGRRLRGWWSVVVMATIRKNAQSPVMLSHRPLEPSQIALSGTIMLHAHSHSRRMTFGDSLRADCGVDATDFWPIPLSSVYDAAREREKTEGRCE